MTYSMYAYMHMNIYIYDSIIYHIYNLCKKKQNIVYI